MSSGNAAAALNERLRDLRRQWQQSAEQWHDQSRAEFSTQYLESLLHDIEEAEQALNHLHTTIQKASRACQ